MALGQLIQASGDLGEGRSLPAPAAEQQQDHQGGGGAQKQGKQQWNRVHRGHPIDGAESKP
jgi:hypothetical protein